MAAPPRRPRYPAMPRALTPRRTRTVPSRGSVLRDSAPDVVHDDSDGNSAEDDSDIMVQSSGHSSHRSSAPLRAPPAARQEETRPTREASSGPTPDNSNTTAPRSSGLRGQPVGRGRRYFDVGESIELGSDEEMVDVGLAHEPGRSSAHLGTPSSRPKVGPSGASTTAETGAPRATEAMRKPASTRPQAVSASGPRMESRHIAHGIDREADDSLAQESRTGNAASTHTASPANPRSPRGPVSSIGNLLSRYD